MSPLYVSLACLVSLAVGLAFGMTLRRRRSRLAGTAALASLGQIDATIKDLEASLALQREETERTRGQRDEEARKAREYFDRIDGIVKEADECRRLLVRTGAEHGMAQAMMLAEIDSLVHQYRALAKEYHHATGKPATRAEPRLNAAIQVVAADFREAHVAPYEKAHPPAPVQASPPTGG